MLLPLVILALLTLSTDARVSFPYSEVHQENDLVNGETNFNCDYGCKVYASVPSATLIITQNGNDVATFADITGADASYPTGKVLPAGANYKIVNRGAATPFVFYSVRTDAPNIQTTVAIPQKATGIFDQRNDRFLTILNNFETMWFFDFQGVFPAGYPRIYTTGFDAANDGMCETVYQARSQWNAENSWLTISGAVITVDFGFTGEHAVACMEKAANEPMRLDTGSTVYMSPGHVGCKYNRGLSYYNQIKLVQDQISIASNSLNLYATYDSLSANEILYLTINTDKLQMKDSGTTEKFYQKGNIDVTINWSRSTDESSFAVQLDRGDEAVSPSPDGVSPSPTTQRTVPTTSGATKAAETVRTTIRVASTEVSRTEVTTTQIPTTQRASTDFTTSSSRNFRKYVTIVLCALVIN